MASRQDRQTIETALREKLDRAGSALGADRNNSLKWRDYETAVQRFNDFVLYGKVPLDLAGDAAEGIHNGSPGRSLPYSD